MLWQNALARRNNPILGGLGLWLAIAQAAQADLAVVTSQTAGILSFVDTKTAQILHEVEFAGQPAAIAVTSAYVASIAVGTKRLHLYDIHGNLVQSRTFDGAPFGLAFGPQNDLYVTDAKGEGFIHHLSVPELTLLQSLEGAENPTGIDADQSGYVVAAARDADLALIYTPACSSCTPKRVAVGHHPFGVTLHDGYAFVTNVLSDDVSVIDLAKGEEIARIPTGARPYAVAFFQGRGFVSNQYDASLTVFDTQSFASIATIETAEYPEGLSVTSDGKVLVAAWFSDVLQIFDAQSFALKAEIEMPEGPRAFGRFVTPHRGP